MIKTPNEIKKHADKYNTDAWKEYSPAELGQWVALLVKRAGHRSDSTKKTKDLDDAQNYLHMLQAHVDAARTLGTEG